MIAGQNEIRNRIDELKLSFTGYKRQLGAAYVTSERRERLENDVRLLEEEIATLEKLAQLGHMEPDPAKIEASARERLAHVRERLASDPALAAYSEEQRDLASGEVKALVWALGEDRITRQVREMVAGREKANPEITARNLPLILMRNLQNGPDADTRASAAYELGRLGAVEAIPRLVAALGDERLVADLAFDALCRYSDAQLDEAGIPGQLRDQIQAARSERERS